MSDSDGDGGARSWLGRVTDLFSVELATRKDLMEVLRDAADKQLLDGDVLNIIFGALTVSDMHARDIMIPRSQLVTVSADVRLEELLPVIIESQHSRFPVVGEDLDDVKGILHAKDLLPLLLEDEWDSFDIRDCIRPASVIPESKRLNVLLQEFRTTRNHMAVVVDEYGHVSGGITIEDVLEQIVGDIEDEHDIDEESAIKQLDANSYTVKATTPIDEFNEYFDTDFDDDEFDTIGGLVLKHFGHLPKREETGCVGEFKFRVLSADSRRIRLLHMTRMASEA